jgi:hypothetical protein
MRRKILMGVFALALPTGLMAATQSAAFAKAVDNPISCSGFNATVTFGTQLSPSGVPTASKTGIATSITGGSFTCGAQSGGTGTLTIPGGKNAKLAKTDPNYNKTTGVKYVTGTWAEFTSAGGSLKKSLKSIPFTVGGQATPFSAKGSTIVVGGACGAGVGFDITGQVKSGLYLNKKSGAHVLACLTTDTGPGASGTFIADYGVANGVATAHIGGNSAAIL